MGARDSKRIETRGRGGPFPREPGTGHRRCPFHRCRKGKGHLLKSDALKSPRIWKGHKHLSENSVYVTALFLSPRTAIRRHTHWANQTTEMYGPTVPEAGRPRWGKQGHPPLEDAREGSVPGLPSSFPSFTCSPWPPWLVDASPLLCLQLHEATSLCGRLCLCPNSPPPHRGRTGWFRSYANDLISTWPSTKKSHVQIRSRARGGRDGGA